MKKDQEIQANSIKPSSLTLNEQSSDRLIENGPNNSSQRQMEVAKEDSQG